ncbi:MAG: type IV pilus modification PilV family protein [Candidatus Saccharibacteria bacterium]
MKCHTKQNGFSLIELLVALTILVIAVVGLVPLLNYIASASTNNKLQAEAAEIAASQLEEIRARAYNDIGLVGGNPNGTIEAVYQISANGITYDIQRNVWWDTDTSGNTIPDLKKVMVRVQAINTFTGLQQTVTYYTKISRESSPIFALGGGLDVIVLRNDGLTPVPDVKADIGTTNQFSDGTGHARMLEILPADQNYTLNVTSLSDPRLMIRPDLQNNQVYIADKTMTSKEIRMDYPGTLSVQLVPKPDSGQLEILGPTGCSSQNESITLTADPQDTFIFSGRYPGCWTVRVTSGSNTREESVNIGPNDYVSKVINCNF